MVRRGRAKRGTHHSVLSLTGKEDVETVGLTEVWELSEEYVTCYTSLPPPLWHVSLTLSQLSSVTNRPKAARPRPDA